MSFFSEINSRNRAGEALALASVCSAHPDVLAASLLLAQERQRPVLIEATSNQVNQFGGYTGMTPADFINFVQEIAAAYDVDPTLIQFGGDHLGPQVWRTEPAARAMAKAEDLMRAYVQAGFTKIHLDCSEGCAGEPAQVSDEVSAARAARLAAICEAAAPDPEAISYVIGTEVPPPGGARADEEGQGVTPTSPERARQTLECHRQAFSAAGVAHAWDRIIALVVQPGLEFAPMHVDHFDLTQPNRLSAALCDDPHICFEAHSTDYQLHSVFPALAQRNFSVLKVGPALTFAYRRGLYALDHVRSVLIPAPGGPAIGATMEALMRAAPESWAKHYEGDPQALRMQRHFGNADRIRYYWPDPAAQLAVTALFSDLAEVQASQPVLLQYFSPQILARAETLQPRARSWAHALVLAEVQAALAPYFFD